MDFESRQQIGELEPLKSEQFNLNYQKAGDVAKLLAGLSPLPGAATNTALRMLGKRGSVIADDKSNISEYIKVEDVDGKAVLRVDRDGAAENGGITHDWADLLIIEGKTASELQDLINNQIIISNTNYSPFQPLIYYLFIFCYIKLYIILV